MTPPLAAVFDCTVFAQSLINPIGPAGECLSAAQAGRVRLMVSDYIIQEIRELPDKLPARLTRVVTRERVSDFIIDLAKYTEFVENVSEAFTYPRDPDDAHYVNLALAGKAKYVVTRDNDLLALLDPNRPEAREFRKQFPSLEIIEPQSLLRRLIADRLSP